MPGGGRSCRGRGEEVSATKSRLEGASREGRQGWMFRCCPLDNMKMCWRYPVATYAFMLSYRTWGRRTGMKNNIFVLALCLSVSSVVYVFVSTVYKRVDPLRRLQVVKPQEWVCFSSSKCLATKQFPLLLFASLACVLTFLFWTLS